jgi:hypothetical protein
MLIPRRVLIVLAAGLTGLAGCAQQQTASESPRIVEETVALASATVPMKI